MIRVCKPGGKVIIADVVVMLPADKVEKYDVLELIRDPSHVHALTHADMESMVKSSSLVNVKTAHCKVEIGLDDQMTASFPKEGDEIVIRKMFADELMKDRMGIKVHYKDDKIHYEVPITIIVGHC